MRNDKCIPIIWRNARHISLWRIASQQLSALCCMLLVACLFSVPATNRTIWSRTSPRCQPQKLHVRKPRLMVLHGRRRDGDAAAVFQIRHDGRR